MNILGLNGLGVLPSACIVQDGKLVAMAEEERFTRYKGSFGMMPAMSAKFCLDFAGLQLKNVNFIAFGWDCPYYVYKMPFFLLGKSLRHFWEYQSASNYYQAITDLLKYRPSNLEAAIHQMFGSAGITGDVPEIRFVNHHMSHAASAYYASGFKKAHVLVIDGRGENTCTSIWSGSENGLRKIKSVNIPHSLGWFYQCITEYLGFTPNSHEGKTMALAAYGEYDKKLFQSFSKIIKSDDKGNYRFDSKYAFTGKHDRGSVYSTELVKLLGPPRLKNEEFSQRHKDIAFAAQHILENITVNIVKGISSLPDFNGNLCLAGGVTLNCKMNGKIAELDTVKNIYIPPFANDTGSALGAAQILSVATGISCNYKLTHAYWGPQYSNSYIKEKLEKFGIKFSEEENMPFKIASLLSDGKIVGWFQGRTEIGSRALGSRSILANPMLPDIKDYVNRKVKGRENWRPFAASILYEKRFDFVDSQHDSPFMTLAFTVKDEIVQKVPSATHI
ncbi:MAG: carbamoyltransferase N-terminal domain-containing protein, partial [Bacteroidales bacterium]|nr:carbamoyltransferase N-terminal domain-containing protein [Bacteroidales bacterium]